MQFDLREIGAKYFPRASGITEKINFRFSRRHLRYPLLAFSLIVLWQLVDIAPRLFFDVKAFQARLDMQIDQSRLAISYQGIDVGFFRGIRVIGLRVSFDRDFSRGRYLIEAPFVYMKVPLFASAGDSADWLSRSRIVLEDAKIGYWLTADQGDKDTLSQARDILRKNLRYHVECNDCQFYLNVKDNSYFQEVTPVERVYLTLKHDGKELQSLIRYESSVIGDGDFFGKFAACVSSLCDDLEGYWYFKPSHLKLSVLNNFQKELDIYGGFATGEIAFDRKVLAQVKKVNGKDVTASEASSNFRMSMASKDLMIRRKKADWYKSEAVSVDTRMTIKGSSSTGFLKMNLDGYGMQVDFEDLRPDELPEKYIFTVKPGSFAKKTLNLPAQIGISGLKNFSVELAERRGQKYTRTNVNLEISEGGINLGAGNKIPRIRVPELKLDLTNEKLSGKLQAESGSSVLNATAEGYLELYPVYFRPLADALLRESEDAVERKIFSLKGKVTVPVAVQNLYWSDLKPYLNAWLDEYWSEVRDGIQYSWLPSHLVRREYFVRFIQYLDFYMPIDIKNFDWGAGKPTPLKGNLFFSPAYFGAGFKLETPDASTSTQLSVAFVGGDSPYAPYMTHTLKLNLEQSYELLTPWFGADYFEYFSSAEIVHSNNFNGERPADHYLKSISVTDVRLKRVRLGNWARQQGLPLQWETVDIRVNRANGFGAISSIRAENDNTLLSGYGDYKLFDRQIETNLKYVIVAK